MNSNIPISKELFPLVDNVPRLEVLYAKENFDNNTVDFWNKAIKGYCIHNKTFLFTLSKLVSFFTIKNGAIPTSIKKSIDVLESSDKIIKRENFFDSNSSKATNSIFNVIINFGSMFISKKSNDNDDENDDINDDTIYICKALVRNVEEKLLKYVDTCLDDDLCFYIDGMDLESSENNDITTTIYLKNIIKRLAIYVKNTSTISNSITPNVSPNPSNNATANNLLYDFNTVALLDSISDENNDLKILWTYMKLQGSAIITEDNLIIKFIKKSKNNISNNSNSSAINEGDRARLELLKSMSTIRKKISSLENEIKECKHKAVKHKLNNDHNSALFECKILRLKTDHNKRLYTSLCTLEMAINNIEKVDMNRTMLNAYVIATKGLKAAQENLSIETLEDAIDAFNEQVNEVQQYEDMIADAVGVNQYDEELEKELDALISGNTDEGITTTPIKNNINDITLPAVPNHPILIHNNSNQKSLIESSSEKQLPESL